MLEFKKLEIKDKQIFESYMNGHGYRHSEASFSNLFIWQNAWNIEWAEDGEALYMKMEGDAYRPFFLPPYLKDWSKSCQPHMKKVEQYMQNASGGFYVKCAIPEMVQKIIEDCGRRYRFAYDAANSEYVYNTADLARLEGKKYHAKRNHINAFLKRHTFEFYDYSSEWQEACLQIHNSWMEEHRDSTEKDVADELVATSRALMYFEQLNFTGCVIVADGVPAAFSMGERISPDTAIIHIEKACCGFDGLYQLINREFAARRFADTSFINRAEDMGMEGLRRAKLSYYPAFMLKRYDCLLGG